MSNKYLSLFLCLLVLGCSPKTFKSKWLDEQAPESFKAKFETTKGDFIIEARRSWSPAGVDRLYQLIKHNFYSDIAIFRVVPDFVVQFGIHPDSAMNTAIKRQKVPDEPVVMKNEKGTVSFARGGPETRSSQLFINIANNSPNLDESNYAGVKGFPVIARVISGMDVVESFYDGYENEPATKQDSIYAKGNDYLRRNYPKIDYILSAELLKK